MRRGLSAPPTGSVVSGSHSRPSAPELPGGGGPARNAYPASDLRMAGMEHGDRRVAGQRLLFMG